MEMTTTSVSTGGATPTHSKVFLEVSTLWYVISLIRYPLETKTNLLFRATLLSRMSGRRSLLWFSHPETAPFLEILSYWMRLPRTLHKCISLSYLRSRITALRSPRLRMAQLRTIRPRRTSSVRLRSPSLCLTPKKLSQSPTVLPSILNLLPLLL